MANYESLLTAEEYQVLPDNGAPSELVRGKTVSLDFSTPRHRQICARIISFVCRFLDDRDLGMLVSNNSAIITERNPDTVRGADVAFYRYRRVSRRPLPDGYLDVVLELVFEVRSPTDRWGQILAKVAEYLQAGVTVACVLDETTEKCHVYRAEGDYQIFSSEQELALPDVLPEFQVVVRRFFE